MEAKRQDNISDVLEFDRATASPQGVPFQLGMRRLLAWERVGIQRAADVADRCYWVLIAFMSVNFKGSRFPWSSRPPGFF